MIVSMGCQKAPEESGKPGREKTLDKKRRDMVE